MSLAPDTELENNRRVVREALVKMCPTTSMSDMFAPMVELAILQIPADSLSSLADDLNSAMGENGEPDLPKLIAVGKKFGLTDEMITGYQQSFAANVPVG